MEGSRWSRWPARVTAPPPRLQVGLAVDAVGRPVPGGPASGFFPLTLQVQHNVILAPSEYAAVTISGSPVRTEAVVSHNTFGGGQRAAAAAEGGTCDAPWLFYCQSGRLSRG